MIQRVYEGYDEDIRGARSHESSSAISNKCLQLEREIAELKGLLKEYRHTLERHSGCWIRTAGLAHGTEIDDRCDLCKRTDAALGVKRG